MQARNEISTRGGKKYIQNSIPSKNIFHNGDFFKQIKQQTYIKKKMFKTIPLATEKIY